MFIFRLSFLVSIDKERKKKREKRINNLSFDPIVRPESVFLPFLVRVVDSWTGRKQLEIQVAQLRSIVRSSSTNDTQS